MCYRLKNIKKSCNNSKFRISAPSQNEKFDLPDGSYSVSDIQDYFDYTIKKQEKLPDNLPIRISVNKIKNRIKREYYLELLTTETMKLLGGTKSKITKDEMAKMCLI